MDQIPWPEVPKQEFGRPMQTALLADDRVMTVESFSGREIFNI
jgi:hypothetical protein